MLITTTLGAALASCALAGTPAPGCNYLTTCQIPYGPAPGHVIYSELLQGVPTNNGDVLYPRPYPYDRPDTTTYTNSGRLWAPATARDKILNELCPGAGPVSFGAGLDECNSSFFIRPNSEPWPDTLVSPWQTINQGTIDEMTRRQPWLIRSPSRTDQMITELRQAQNEYLRQQGLIEHVRTHVNARSFHPAAPTTPAKPAGEVEPSGVIRIRPADPVSPNRLRTSLPNENNAVRISLPDTVTNQPRITVVRDEAETPEQADTQQQASATDQG